jgi:hypothetical protein
VFESIDALAGDTQARTPVELSLSSLFQRQYPSIYDGLDGWRLEHFNRFVKQHLLFNAAHLGVTEHEKKFVQGGLWPIRNSIWLALRYPARCDLGNATNLSRLTNVRPHPPKLDAAMLDFSPGWVKL